MASPHTMAGDHVSELPQASMRASDEEAPQLDEENPPEPMLLPTNGPAARFATDAHAHTAKFLYDASVTGRLGSGPAEPDMSTSSTLSVIFNTIPWPILTTQLIWSGIVLAIAYGLRPTNPDESNTISSLSVDFWTSKLNVSSSIAYGVGWALFVLLGFFVREANGRYQEAHLKIEEATSCGRQFLRLMRQMHPPGMWHPGDLDRMAAHLVAVPIALKMTLRGERERQQLEHILHPDDVTDVLATDLMYIQCTRVLRAYLISAEKNSLYSFPHSASDTVSACEASRIHSGRLVDAMDKACNAAVRIAHFGPSVGYISHLRNFLYIWSFFLPLVLVQTSGWFMPLFSVIITYCVSMLFTIAEALNKPYGFDLQDIKLNRICAEWGYQLLWEHSTCKYSMKDNVRADHETPNWLERPLDKEDSGDAKKRSALRRKMKHAYEGAGRNLGSSFVLKNLALFIAWQSLIIFLSWRLTLNQDVPREPADRWWSIYLPVSTSTTGFISLGVFLLLGFWMNDAYARYWNCLQIWNSNIRPAVQGLSFALAIMHRKGFWHSRDRQRLFSFWVAFVYSVKLHLRQSRDVTELEGVLDPHDLQALAHSPHLPNHCLNVLYAYFNSADAMEEGCVQSKDRHFGNDTDTHILRMKSLESAIQECDATRKYPMSLSFTLHLFVFVTIWLAMLAISLVKENGFLTYLFIVPVAYAIINLLNIGINLSDPFGFDEEDIPMDTMCDDIKADVHAMYLEMEEEDEGYIREEPYHREDFTPRSMQHLPQLAASSDEEDEGEGEGEDNDSIEKVKLLLADKPDEEESQYTLRKFAQGMLDHIPHVSPVAQLVATLWSIFTVILSWRLSKISEDWSLGLRGGCQEWCSPIDVDGDTLANIGYALFMLLSFRASDAIGRYEHGAELVFELKLQLHSIAVDTIHTLQQNYLHTNDRERMIAFITQIPLLIRDKLLQGDEFNPVCDDTLLSPNDQRRMGESADPFEYVVRTLETYVLVLKKSNKEPFTSKPLNIHGKTLEIMSYRMEVIRSLYASMLSVKRFPVISRYSNHQYIFTALWLGLLPLYMTRQTGFFTILWSPLISYGVFALQSIAEKLVDPFGEDAIDIPIHKLLTETAEEVLTTVEAHDWDCIKYSNPSPVDSRPSLGSDLSADGVGAKRYFAHFENHEVTVDNFGKSPLLDFKSSEVSKEKPNLLVHLVYSVPWWVLLGIVSWTAIGCVISYLSRESTVTDVRWWRSGVSVGTNVARYVSFAAFILLGFYVQAAFRRYTQAGTVWGDNLRAACHAIAVLSSNIVQDGYVHEGDHKRILAHVAAIPLVLKLELRGSRDLRELKGLLSFEDIARIQSAHIMTTHCVDVLRSYWHTVMHHKERLVHPLAPWGNRHTLPNMAIGDLQVAVQSARFLNEFHIAPGFIILLNSLLAIWFLFLPFVLAEISGWFTILWVAIIAYGVLGMYSVAEELQSPFGLDVNDLDLDKIADFIVRDILFVQKNYVGNTKALTRPSPPTDLWDEETKFESKRGSFYIDDENAPFGVRLKEGVRLAVQSVTPFQMAFSFVWAVVCVAIAYGTSKWFPLEKGVCKSQWFCTYIAVDGSLKGFIGFALFLLLGFRMYDSHARYVMAVRLWHDELLGLTRTLVTRLLCATPPGLYHEGDVKRICGHLAAFAICSMGALRGEDCRDKLAQVVCEEDVERILSAQERIDYCMDVVRAYSIEGNWMRVLKPGSEPSGSFETTRIFLTMRVLATSAYECRRLVRIPLPFGYLQHLKIFLYIWLLLLPLGLVEDTGWLTIIWVVIIAYGVFGVEHWAAELANPFGHDVSDVPLDEMCDRIIGEIKESHAQIAGRGVGVWMQPERSGLNAA